MACELRLLASLHCLKQCQKYLFMDTQDDINWLHKCVVAVSPMRDLAVVARGSALVILTAQWGNKSGDKNIPNYTVSKQWECLESGSQRDEITCAMLLPIAENRRHSSNGPDWTCIVLGFSSGQIGFYTENMDRLIQHPLHREPLQNIRATSGKKKKSDANESPEAVYAVFPSVICSFSAFSLFQTLRTCRSKLALTLARAQNERSEITLDFKKFAFNKNTIRDASFICCASGNNFDHLLNVSLRGNYQASPPQHSTVVCTGENIYLQYLTTTEGVGAPLDVADVALSVIGNIVRNSWMGFMRNDVKETPEKPAEKLAEQFSLVDRERDGRAIVVSPDSSLLAVTDSLGRVTLVDARTGVSLRLWKGYRNAECGFLEVEEDVTKRRRKRGSHHESSSKVKPRRVQVIVIYAPKKGLIEIFPIRHGPRISAIRVSKNGRLIYTPYHLFGLEAEPRKSHATPSPPVNFLCEDGFMDITVPFHCASLDANSNAKDLHNLKELKVWLKEGDHDEKEILERIQVVSKDLETNDVRFQAIDLIVSIKNVSPAVLSSALEVFLDVAPYDDNSASSGNDRDLIMYCKQMRRIVKFYDFLEQLKPTDADVPIDSSPLTDLLILPESEVKTLFELLNNVQFVFGIKRQNRVKFHENNSCDLSTLLKYLDVSDSSTVMAKPDIKEDELCSLGDLFFRNIVNNLDKLESWTAEARSSNISSNLISRSFLIYWLNRPIDNTEQDMRKFIPLLQSITTLSEESIVASDYNLESSWWTEVRNVIASSSKPIVALTTAVACRAVTIMCEQQAEIHKSGKTDTSADVNQGWENVSADTWQWDLLISHLEDVAILNAVLSVKSSKPKDEAWEACEKSLHEIVSGGESSVSELVAKWLGNFSISPNLLVNKSDVEFQLNIDSPELLDKRRKHTLKCDEELIFPLVEIAEEVQPGSESEQIILGHLSALKKRFPYSLTSSVILSHIFWEHMNKWQWNLSQIATLQLAVCQLESMPSTHLQIGMGCLAWNAFLKIPVETITRIIAKLGKLPTDTLCTKELGIARKQILPLLCSASRLLQIIVDACAQRPLSTFIFRHESIWRESKPGLVRVASSRALPSKHIVYLHYMVINIFRLMAELDLRNRTLLPIIFDSLKGQLFGELTQQKEINVNTLGLSDSLTQFLHNALMAAVQSESDNVKTDPSQSVSLRHFKFCLEIAIDWQVPLDAVRGQYVCELYSSGYDRLAETFVDDVDDKQTLASQLLVIVGQRVNIIVHSASSPQEIITCFSPFLTSWLGTLGRGRSSGQMSSEEDLDILLRRIISWLQDDSADRIIASLLVESIPGISSIS